MLAQKGTNSSLSLSHFSRLSACFGVGSTLELDHHGKAQSENCCCSHFCGNCCNRSRCRSRNKWLPQEEWIRLEFVTRDNHFASSFLATLTRAILVAHGTWADEQPNDCSHCHADKCPDKLSCSDESTYDETYAITDTRPHSQRLHLSSQVVLAPGLLLARRDIRETMVFGMCEV